MSGSVGWRVEELSRNQPSIENLAERSIESVWAQRDASSADDSATQNGSQIDDELMLKMVK